MAVDVQGSAAGSEAGPQVGSEGVPGRAAPVPGARAVTVRVPAKINLYLGVGPLRADGYHDLTTVYHAIGLYDEVTAEALHETTTGRATGTTTDRATGSGDPEPPAGVSLTITGEGAGDLPVDRRNLAVAAALALARHTGCQPSVRLSLRKRIPVAGGLAGGSADAAATLVACDALWGSRLPRDDLAGLAAELGSDVPFPLYGGVAIGTGRGELVDPLPAVGTTLHWVVAIADGGLSTPAVYAELDRLRADGLAPPPQPAGVPRALIAALDQEDPAVLGAAMRNDLEPAAFSLRPGLRAVLDAGRAAGALGGIVSGSGPTCVFLAGSADAAGTLAQALATVPGCRRAYPVTGPVPGARAVADRGPASGTSGTTGVKAG